MVDIEALMEKYEVSHSLLCLSWEAHDYLSRTSSEVKLKKLSLEERHKITEFYKHCRREGFYPSKPKGLNMIFQRLINRKDAYDQLHKKHNMAPASLAAMEPPPPKKKQEQKVFQDALKLAKKGEIKFDPED